MMEINSRLKPRDPIMPSSYFLRKVPLIQRGIRANRHIPEFAQSTSLAGDTLHLAKALYSAGASPAKCYAPLKDSVKALIGKLQSSRHRPILGIPHIHLYMEVFSAARIVGKQKELASAWKSATFKVLEPWERSLLDGLVAALTGGRAARVRLAEKKTYIQGPLCAAVINAVLKKDKKGFGPALEKYLLKEYGPDANRGANRQRANKSRDSHYVGTWTLFPLAMCQAMGTLPSLNPKALQHIPVELM